MPLHPSTSSAGAALTQPQIPTGAANSSPEQRNLWQKFQSKLRDDPNFRMSLMTAGLNMLRTPQPGQTGFDTFAEGALTGVQTLDQLRQRDASDVLAGAEEDRAERRTRSTETRATAAQDRVLQSAEQFNANNTLALAKFEEEKRQFGVEQASGTSNQSTGGERTTRRIQAALMTMNPDLYPDTDEGKAGAFLAASSFKPDDPFAQARIVSQLITDMTELNSRAVTFNDATPLDSAEIQRRAIETFKVISGDLDEIRDAPLGETTPDITHPIHGVGKVKQLGPDQFEVTFSTGIKVVTKAQLDTLRGDNVNP